MNFLAQSLKMWAVCSLKQRICCSYLCKLSISEDLLHSGGVSVSHAAEERDQREAISMPTLQPSAPHRAASPGEHRCGRNSTECWRTVSSTEYFLLASSTNFNSFGNVSEKPRGTDLSLLLCFCRVLGLTSASDELIHHSGFISTEIRN